MQRIMVIEATGDQSAADNEGKIPPPKVELKPLIHERQTDATFLEYDKSGMDKIRSAFRLPPLFIGRSEEMTYATAKTSYEVAESQVFAPERQRFDDMINLKILSTYQPKYWAFRSNPPRLSDSAELIDAIAAFDGAGALTPNVAIGIANELFDLEIAPVEEDWGNYPFSMVESMLGAGKLRIDLQNEEPPPPPPALGKPGMDKDGNPVAPGKPGEKPDEAAGDPANENASTADVADVPGKKPARKSKAAKRQEMIDNTAQAMLALRERLIDMAGE
jgi:hypothetical protein